MTYEQLLVTEQWINKRNSIVERDNFKCKRCQNLKLITDPEIGTAFFEKGWRETIDSTNNDGLRVYDPKNDTYTTLRMDSGVARLDHDAVVYFDRYCGSVQSIRKIMPFEVDQYKYNKALLKKQKLEKLIKMFQIGKVSADEAAKEMAKSVFEPADHYLNPARLTITAEDLTAFDWIIVKGLNVHHTYYKTNLLPWEYPDDSLETYCQPCHKELHSGIKIPYYDGDGNLIKSLTTCSRCGGSGWFPQYKHVEGGICFKCLGARYHELVKA